ncbi:hypothetical protein ACFE04_027933 [Oxalis oulophora]
MASSFVTPLILLAICSLIYPTVGVNKKALTGICSKTKSPSACLKYLNSDPQTAVLSAQKLLSMTISSAQKLGEEHIKMFSVMNVTMDKELKKDAIIGLKYYSAIEEKLMEAQKLSKKQYSQSAHLLTKTLDLISKFEAETSAKSEFFKVFNDIMYFEVEVAEKINLYMIRN